MTINQTYPNSNVTPLHGPQSPEDEIKLGIASVRAVRFIVRDWLLHCATGDIGPAYREDERWKKLYDGTLDRDLPPGAAARLARLFLGAAAAMRGDAEAKGEDVPTWPVDLGSMTPEQRSRLKSEIEYMEEVANDHQ